MYTYRNTMSDAVRALTYQHAMLKQELVSLEALHHEACLQQQAWEQKLVRFMPCFFDTHAPNLSSLITLDTITFDQKTISGIAIKIPTHIQLNETALPKLFTPVWVVRAQPLLLAYAQSTIHKTFIDIAMKEVSGGLKKTARALRTQTMPTKTEAYS